MPSRNSHRPPGAGHLQIVIATRILECRAYVLAADWPVAAASRARAGVRGPRRRDTRPRVLARLCLALPLALCRALEC